jgi:hypothetical protein
MTTTPPMTMTTEAAPVLTQHRFDESRLEHYLRTHLPECTPPLSVAQTLGVSTVRSQSKMAFPHADY